MSSAGKPRWQREIEHFNISICRTTSSKGNYPPTTLTSRCHTENHKEVLPSHSWLEQGWAEGKAANCQVTGAWSSMKRWELGQSDYLCWEWGIGKRGARKLVSRRLSQFITRLVSREAGEVVVNQQGEVGAGQWGEEIWTARERDEDLEKLWEMGNLINIWSTWQKQNPNVL